MKTQLLFTAALLAASVCSFAQNGWTICNSPAFTNRVDDIFMVNTQTGYAVCGDGQIVKTTDGGNNWVLLAQDPAVRGRSIEFINSQKGFVGAFTYNAASNNILRRTDDGGANWTDLTSLLNPKAGKGICGLAVADTNTIYGCGNWSQDSAYIVKSTDGGNTWNFIDMSNYATSLIDMHFIDKDTGFATGKGPLPLETAIILYTTDGGQNWTYKFQNTIAYEYCWKIQRFTNKIYFASIEDLSFVPPRILKSIDGGMTWTVYQVDPTAYNIEGIGFIDSLKGWTGGDYGNSFESNDGGITWNPINICPLMNRVFKVNDTLLFASGDQIWKYSPTTNGIIPVTSKTPQYASINCHPNPVKENLTIDVSLSMSTHALIIVFDDKGNKIKIIDNNDKPKGDFQYILNTKDFAQGIYYIVLKTHEDKQTAKVIVRH